MRDQVEPGKLVEVIDLARAADFDLGILRIRPSLRRIGVGGKEESVEPRVMQALIALSEANGAVVSRDALIDRCWGGRIVGEDAINRCIAKVRRVAAMTKPAAFTIETVSKIGYRLLALDGPSHVSDVAAAETSEPGGRAFWALRLVPRRLPRWWVCAGVALVASFGVAVGLWHSDATSQWTVQGSRPFMPSLDGQSDPRTSPNGSMLAYVAKAVGGPGRIFVKSLQGGSPVPVSSVGENATSPAWAVDGARLAYAVVGSGGAPCRIMVTAFPGGTPVIVGRCWSVASPDLTWQPGSPYLLFGDKPPGERSLFGSIVRMNVETGVIEQVTSPPVSEDDDHVRASPDGHSLAYIRDRGFAGRALRLRNIVTGQERELDSDRDVTSVDWSPDSQTLIETAPGQLGGEILAYPVDGGPPYRVYTTASDLGTLAIGSNGTLAVAVSQSRAVLARASVAPRATPDVVDPAAGQSGWPAFAPDGTLAFVSDRSGEIALWTRKRGGEPIERVSAGIKDIERPVWSPDSTRIAFFEVWKGKITVQVVAANGENVISFPVPSIGFGMPNWTPDGEHLVMFDKRILRPVLVDVRNPDHREPVEEYRWDSITYYRGAMYSALADKPGLWQLRAAPGGAARLITPDYPALRAARIAFVADCVLLPESSGPGDIRVLAQPLAGGAAHVAFYAPAAEAGTPFAVDPISGDVVYDSLFAAGGHIELLALDRH